MQAWVGFVGEQRKHKELFRRIEQLAAAGA
jgi:hypothetical protein